MSDQKPDTSELLADSIAREDSLRAYLAECNDARLKLQNEVSEQEQEIADLNREIASLKGIPTPFVAPPVLSDSFISSRELRSSFWAWCSNFIKRLAK